MAKSQLAMAFRNSFVTRQEEEGVMQLTTNNNELYFLLLKQFDPFYNSLPGYLRAEVNAHNLFIAEVNEIGRQLFGRPDYSFL